MKVFICLIALASAVSAGILYSNPAVQHHAPLQILHVHESAPLGQSQIEQLVKIVHNQGYGLQSGHGHGHGHINPSEHVIKVIHETPLVHQQQAHLIKVIHEQAPIVHQAPKHIKIVRVLHAGAPLVHRHSSVGW